MPFSAEHQGDPTRAFVSLHSELTLDQIRREWLTKPTFEGSIEFLSAAIAGGAAQKAMPAAEYLAKVQGELPKSLSSVVAWVLDGAGSRKERAPATAKTPDAAHTEAAQTIANARRRLANFPRNPKHWLDLSLAYSVLNQPIRAERAMLTAVDLAPSHRIVLRSRARMLVHMQRKDEAHDLIRRHVRTPHDPWLMSTEIALAHMQGRPSAFLAKGRRFALDYECGAEHITELAATVAMAEAQAGEHRRAKKLYALALEVPTENVLAQLQFLAKKDDSMVIDKEKLSLPHAMEARTWRAFAEGRWRDAIIDAVAWQIDEPYSSRAAANSSYIAVSLIGDAVLGIECAREGLRSNPDDQLLRNNLVVALMRAGEYTQADVEFKKIRAPIQPHLSEPVFNATSGMIAYLRGDLEEGRRLYQLAMNSPDPRVRSLAAVNWLETEWTFVPAAREVIEKELASKIPKIREPVTKLTAERIVARKAYAGLDLAPTTQSNLAHTYSIYPLL